MRDDRQCSLERAMELLRLKPDRAHDALNDARNTVRVCGSMDLERCMEEYCLRYIDYGPDRLAGRVGGLPYPDLPCGTSGSAADGPDLPLLRPASDLGGVDPEGR